MSNRIKTLGGLAIVAASMLVLGACSGGDGGTDGAPDQVVLAAGGGDYRDYQEEFNVPTMTKCADNIVWDYTDDDVKITKVNTEAGGTGTLDVVELPNERAQQLVESDTLEALDVSEVPNIANVREGLVNEYWIPHIYSASVIIYNENRVTSGTDSYEVLWDPEYAGKIGVLSQQWSNFYYAAAALVSNGQNNDDWDAGWEKLQELKDSVVVFASQEELGQALMSEQVWLTVNWKARALQWNAMGDVPLAASVPQEGTFPIVFVAAVPANAPNKECAFEFLNALLDAEAQVDFALNMGYSPTVTGAELPADQVEVLDFTAEEQERILERDLAYIAENDARWGAQWQQEFIN